MRLITLILFFVVFELYAFQAIRTVTQNKWLLLSYALVVIVILGTFFFYSQNFDDDGFSHQMSYALGLFLALIVFQILVILFLFFEDIIRIPKAIFDFFNGSDKSKDSSFLPKRRKFISQIALALAAVPFSSLLYGMFQGKYNYKVLKYSLEYDDLPEAFDGFTITHISDIHAGSFDNPKKVQYGIDLIKEQQSDVVLFTGDMVNNKAEEVVDWIDTFAEIKAPYGKFSVLGNHDYGDYVKWENAEKKEGNLKALINAEKAMGFQVLLNDAHYLEKDGEKIALLGVENWGKGFKQKGDLNKSLNAVDKNDFKILLSHDPSHWEAEILPHNNPIHLTLSGHTHGMQFGIEIPGWFRWSPAKWRYKQWAGIYERDQQRLNVNRGFGYLAYPGRVGVWPEVSLITLKRRKTVV